MVHIYTPVFCGLFEIVRRGGCRKLVVETASINKTVNRQTQINKTNSVSKQLF
jgi:hypothetical protein